MKRYVNKYWGNRGEERQKNRIVEGAIFVMFVIVMCAGGLLVLIGAIMGWMM